MANTTQNSGKRLINKMKKKAAPAAKKKAASPLAKPKNMYLSKGRNAMFKKLEY